MSIFGIFGKKIPFSVTAHILDPNTGYSKQTWMVGQHVSRETVEKLSEDGNIFVVVFYEAGTPEQIICKRDIWNQTKAQFDSIEETGQAPMCPLSSERTSVELDVAKALTNQTIGGQSVLYRQFRDTIGCEDSTIRRLELTYFAAAVMTYVYLQFGTQPNRDGILDHFTRNVLTKSILSSKEKISFDEVVKEYQGRYAEYSSMLHLLFSPSDSSTENPAAALPVHAFECITQLSAHEHMIHIVVASRLIQEFVLDHIDFVKVKL